MPRSGKNMRALPRPQGKNCPGSGYRGRRALAQPRRRKPLAGFLLRGKIAGYAQTAFCSAPQAADNLLSGAAACAHGQDDRGRAGDDVAAGKDVGDGGFACFLIDLDVAALGLGQIGGGLQQDGIGARAQGHDGQICGHVVFRSGNGHGAAAA